ncbi:spore cortex biosynthesis protein YabQ [Anoxybacillus pushchinoensis]|uniref:Spore cortex biosynthesis protein YabQ n=1 Tax=Anoxybacillus pushchinoensis TaxID=150248 RepID=A0A1I0TK25_9BACL|nr:spore cortex biosynthesis protein YabQ [Anoxybacillus pushchinoensis]SFA51346.1 spore cortex biosynthesis protein YabQ [Anoxybacillus pushchinoensis]
MSLHIQFTTLLAMIGTGFVIGACFDTYAHIFDRSKRHRLIVWIADILFWIVQALYAFYTLLLVNNGEIRFYIFLAILCGYAAYRALFQHVYVRLLRRIIRIIVSLYRLFVRLFYYVIIFPLRLLYRFFVFLLFTTCHFILSIGKILYKAIYVCVLFILQPFMSLGHFVWKKTPLRFQAAIGYFFRVGKGFYMKIANMFRKKV